MKIARSPENLLGELQRQLKTKKDWLTKAAAVQVIEDIKLTAPMVALKGVQGTFGLTETGHLHLAEKAKIPKPYYDRLISKPYLLAQNVNTWFKDDERKFMVRTLDGNVRGLMSDSFRRLENIDAMQVVLPVLEKRGATIVSCEVTEKHLYLQAVSHKLKAEIRKGDVVRAGSIISNSELGYGSVKVEPLVERCTCSNGMVVGQALRKYHVGRKNEFEGDLAKFFSSKTNELDDKVFWMKVRDVVAGAFDEAMFQANVDQLKQFAEVKIKPTEVEDAVELTAQVFTLTEDEKSGVLSNIIKSNDLTQWGLANAVTALAHDADNYERSIEVERFGGDVMRLPNLSKLIAEMGDEKEN
jgi:hypothetical protein